MNLFSSLIVIVIIYVIIVIGLGIVLTWYYRRAYSLRYNLDQVLNQMIYIHASYLYDLRQKGYDTNRINTWFEAKNRGSCKQITQVWILSVYINH